MREIIGQIFALADFKAGCALETISILEPESDLHFCFKAEKPPSHMTSNLGLEGTFQIQGKKATEWQKRVLRRKNLPRD